MGGDCIRREVVAQIESLQDGLLMLGFVLENHAEHVAVAKQRSLGVELGGAQQLHRVAAHLVEIFICLRAVEKRQVAADPARVVERVVHAVVGLVVSGPAADLAQQPVLLEIADVAHVPNDRAHDPVELLVDVVVAQRIDHVMGAGADAIEQAAERRTCGGFGWGGLRWGHRGS